MRAARLLKMLLILQNRGKQTTRQLADELEVSTRTILRDVSALDEAGLPVVVNRGPQGGIELGFNYRTRLTGLSVKETEAMTLVLSQPTPLLRELGLEAPAHLACHKLIESLPDSAKAIVNITLQRFRFKGSATDKHDERISALARAIRESKIVRINCQSYQQPRSIHPVALVYEDFGWSVIDALDEENPVSLSEIGYINISSNKFKMTLSNKQSG